MQKFTELKANVRESMSKGKNNKLRQEGMIPAVISNSGKESTIIAVDKSAFLKILSTEGRSAVFTLNAGKVKYTAMVMEMQHDPITGELLHANFQHVSLDQEIKTEVEVKIIGDELLPKKKLGLILQVEQLEVEGLPTDIPNSIDIDVSNIDGETSFHVKDLDVPKGIKVLAEEDLLIFTTYDLVKAAAAAEAAEEASDEETAAADVEVVGAKKEDEAEEKTEE
ncbi:MAG: 50S ribosomal protein L25 [Clostridia bacterium]|nr:50S ribosomal protein L25 [Clostridia bacterium]